MKLLRGGCVVSSPDDHLVRQEGARSFRTPISRAQGAQHVCQTVSDYAPGWAPPRLNPSAEEVLYCVSGRGAVRMAEAAAHDYALGPGVAAYVPAGCVYALRNDGPDAMRLVAVCCPEDAASRTLPAPLAAPSPGAPASAPPAEARGFTLGVSLA